MAKTALLLMDLQDGIFGRSTVDPGFIERVKSVKAAAKSAGLPIIYVVVKFRKGYPEVGTKNKLFGALKSANLPFTEEDSATAIHASLAPESGDIVVTKRRVGAFTGSDLEVILRGQEIDHLVLTGIATSGVVLSTLRAAADMDYAITVLSDCCHDKDAEVHRVLTEKVFPMQAEVVTSDEWAQSQKK